MDKLLETGWQSWSWRKKPALFKLPSCNFLPTTKNLSNSPATELAIADKQKDPIKGWCSWYAYGPDINEKVINKNIDRLIEINLSNFNHILIDDGWESRWGDWLKPDEQKFPSGLAGFAKSIEDKGFVPGIWIAPFLASPSSALFKNHPDWFITHNGSYIDGLRLTPFDIYFKHKKYILDIRNPQVVAYLDSVFQFLIETCEFKFIKLDFLHAIYFSPVSTPQESDELLKDFLSKIKAKYPKVYTIACGCPLVPAVGLVDSMRIGPDINIPSLIKVPIIGRIFSKFLYQKVLNNIRVRKWTDIFWNLDPDVLLVSDKVHLTDKEVLILKKEIINCRGNLFLGDDLTLLSKERVEKYLSDLR